jgi:NADPH:quinone reductase-like Zn-dependent oxidoreductase
MRAVTIVGDDLVVAERHVDEPVADQLVVEVAGAGINRGDPRCDLRQGRARPGVGQWPPIGDCICALVKKS